jgi:spore maturation protein CgeB
MKNNSISSKKVLFAGWGAENPKDTYMYQIHYTTLRKIFPQLEVFDSKKNYLQYGKNEMNSSFLNKISSKSYDMILMAIDYDEFYPETLMQIKKICPKAKSMIIICDDDAKFDSWSKYISLFFDFVMTSQDVLIDYKKEGLTSFFYYDYNSNHLKPMNIKKIYDVTFIGRPKADRNEVIRYLLNNGINVTLFGWDWHKFKEFKKIYKGPLDQEDYAKIINQTKINLSPSKSGYLEQNNQYNLKGRYYEVSLCKSFQLIEKFPALLKFFTEKEIGMYTSQEDMLQKIRYFLSHEKEREMMAKRAYEKTLKKYNREKRLDFIFNQIFKTESKISLPPLDGKIAILQKEDFSDNLKKKLANYDYVSFKNKNLRYSSKLKNYFLLRAIKTTNNPISCCDYYVSSGRLKDYMVFLSKFSFKRLGKTAKNIIDINQLMVKKEFFLSNLELFKLLIQKNENNIVTEENTSFVSIPLISVKKIKKMDYAIIKKAFEFRFQNDLFSLMFKKKLFANRYPYLLLLHSLKGNTFILKYLFELYKDKSNADKITVNKIYLEEEKKD